MPVDTLVGNDFDWLGRALNVIHRTPTLGCLAAYARPRATS